jgi:prepilin-type N-terminal cleavage/methylation domain-containing protein
MKYKANTSSDPSSGFTLVEVMISMTIAVSVLGMCMSSFLFGLRAMYKDTERLKTNASLRSFMAQVSKETLDASQFYLFRDYTAIDNSVDLESTDSNPAVDTVSMTQIEDVALDDYDKWVGHGD